MVHEGLSVQEVIFIQQLTEPVKNLRQRDLVYC